MSYSHVKIKVLECPKWIKSEMIVATKETLETYFDEIEPLFHRNGRYLLNNKNVIIEYGGKAWKSNRPEESVIQFHKDLIEDEYDKVNMLSRDQINAIQVLMKIGLASEKQMSVYNATNSRKKAKSVRLKLMKRWKKRLKGESEADT